MPTPKPKRRSPEHDMQVALFKWAALAGNLDPRIRLLFAVPNGGHRDPRTAARLRAEGVKPGVPDVFLPVAAGGYHGLWLELKAGKNNPSPEQKAWIAQLNDQGYYVGLVYDNWQQASLIVESYLKGVLKRSFTNTR